MLVSLGKTLSRASTINGIVSPSDVEATQPVVLCYSHPNEPVEQSVPESCLMNTREREGSWVILRSSSRGRAPPPRVLRENRFHGRGTALGEQTS